MAKCADAGEDIGDVVARLMKAGSKTDFVKKQLVELQRLVELSDFANAADLCKDIYAGLEGYAREAAGTVHGTENRHHGQWVKVMQSSFSAKWAMFSGDLIRQARRQHKRDIATKTKRFCAFW